MKGRTPAVISWVLAEFLRTDHAHLRPLLPDSVQAQELKMMTRDHQRVGRHQSRLLNQLTTTLKEYYPRPLELFGDLTTETALDFLKQYPTPAELSKLSRKRWERFAQEHRLGRARAAELWQKLNQPQLPIPEHVVRAKAHLVDVLVDQLKLLVSAVEQYAKRIERFFASMPAAEVTKKLPGGKSGTTVPRVWAELGDAPGRWESFEHLQAQGGTAPVTKRSGKSWVVQFRYACNKHLRHASYLLASISLRQSERPEVVAAHVSG